MSDADVKLDVGRELTRGLGAGADPEVGKQGRRGPRGGDRGGPQGAPTWSSSPPARAAAPAPVARPSSPGSPGPRRPDDRCRHPPVHLRGPPPRQPGRDRHRAAARGGRHPHRHPERPAAVDQRPRRLDARRVPQRRPGAALRCPGHHRPDHHARPDQPRLRRRQVGHAGRRAPRSWASARPAARTAPSRPPSWRSPARCSRPASTAPTACCSPSRAAPTSACSRSTRRPAWSRRPRTPRPTSSSARSSTTPSATRCGSPSSRPGSTAAAPLHRGRRPGARHRPGPVRAGPGGRCPGTRGAPGHPAGAGRAARAGRPVQRRRRPHRAPRGPRRAGPCAAAPAAAHGHLRRERRPRRPGLPQVVLDAQQGRAGHPARPSRVYGDGVFAWHEDRSGVVRAVTDRSAGVSGGRYAGLNLGAHVDDDAGCRGREPPAAHRAASAGPSSTWTSATAPRSPSSTGVPDVPPSCDAVVTRSSEVALAVLVADCVPVLLSGTGGVVAAVHAGRPGLVAGVVPRTLDVMRELGAGEVDAVVGPSVCGRCYEVPEAMRDVAARGPAGERHGVVDRHAGHRRRGRGRRPSCATPASRCAGCPAARESATTSTPTVVTAGTGRFAGVVARSEA